jgi:hypothetical protein
VVSDLHGYIFGNAQGIVSGIHPGYRNEGSRQTPSRIPLYSY